MPRDVECTIRPLEQRHWAAVRALWSARFGAKRATQENWFEAVAADDRPAVGLVAEAPPADEIVGFSFLDIAGRSHTVDYLGLDVLGLTPPLSNRNGIFHLSCVRAEWEGRGIGSAFYERRLDILSERDVFRAFGISWHRPDASHDSRALFEKWGFEAFATVENYYRRTEEREHCPLCEGNCTCTASLYLRTGIRR